MGALLSGEVKVDDNLHHEPVFTIINSVLQVKVWLSRLSAARRDHVYRNPRRFIGASFDGRSRPGIRLPRT